QRPAGLPPAPGVAPDAADTPPPAVTAIVKFAAPASALPSNAAAISPSSVVARHHGAARKTGLRCPDWLHGLSLDLPMGCPSRSGILRLGRHCKCREQQHEGRSLIGGKCSFLQYAHRVDARL